MRLVNYGVGEIVDRLTILSLKIAYGSAAGRDVGHFSTEWAALLTQLRGKTLNGAWFEQVLTLATVNGMLWRAEDALREWRTPLTSGRTIDRNIDGLVAKIACEIQALNDQRAELVETINKLTGEHLGSEKV